MTAQDYAELIDRILSTFRYLEDSPRFPFHIYIPENNPSFLRWKEAIPLQNNLCLTVKETIVFENGEISERSFAYDFRDMSINRMIWRIDNHCRLQPANCPCHVHANPDNEKESNEYFPDSKKVDFPYAMRCVKRFFEEESQEWEEVPHDATM